jgi:hypothetical protein
MNPFREETISDLMSHAASGNRIKVNGKTIWSGLGDRTSLYDYTAVLLNEKWEKGNVRLKKKLESLDKYKDTVGVWVYYNSGRFKGKWELETTYHVSK